MTENPQSRNRRYVTYEKFSEILGKFPEKVREYAREAFADYIPRISLFQRLFGIDEKTDPAEIDPKKMLAGYGSVKELAEEVGRLKRETEPGAKTRKGQRDLAGERDISDQLGKIEKCLRAVISSLYEGPERESYLKLLDGDKKA